MKKQDWIRRCSYLLPVQPLLIQGEHMIQEFHQPEKEAGKRMRPKTDHPLMAMSVLLLVCMGLLTALAIRDEQPVMVEVVIWLAGNVGSLAYVMRGERICQHQGAISDTIRLICIGLIWLVLIVGCVLHIVLVQRLPVMWLLFAMKAGCVLLFAVGVWGLVKSRMEDRRWMAIYVLCLTVILLCSIVFSMICSMNLTSTDDISQQTGTIAVTGLTGFLSAGWLLCQKRYQ